MSGATGQGLAGGKIIVSCSRPEKAPPYVAALEGVGVPSSRIDVLPANETPRKGLEERAGGAAGLLLCGGPDLDPRHYGEERHPHANLSIMEERDLQELDLLAGAREARTPVFGICRGLQTLNVFFGGTLWQDLRLMWPGSLLHDLSFPRDALIHPLRVTAADTALGALLQAEASLVNSRHHQAVKDLCSELEPVAVAPDGIVEAAIGVEPGWWIWAVQWHPENLVSLDSQKVLFARFHDAIEARYAGREVTAR